MKAPDELVPHLFRTEYKKITAVLIRHFGLHDIQIAEDIASETFVAAAETWGVKGIPPNPTAWLYAVAKNKAKDHVKRSVLFQNKISPVIQQITETAGETIDLSEDNINDSQLRMIFAICHPSLPKESQIALALRILCGLGIDEIASAFLTSKETINKRLLRGKEKLREENISIELPDDLSFTDRLEEVLTTLYLLFNEGYYSSSNQTSLRHDMCFEAMRLTSLLTQFEKTNTPSVNALLALMCFHASRFNSRVAEGEILLYYDQDRTKWNFELIRQGEFFLNKAAKGEGLHRYHLQAAIAYWHCQQDDQEKWEHILQLYNQLLQLEYSPVAALNRTYALYRARGFEVAIVEVEKLTSLNNHFLFTLLGDMYANRDRQKSALYYSTALGLARKDAERNVITEKIRRLGEIN